MDRELLRHANKLVRCQEVLVEIKRVFDMCPIPSVNHVSTSGLTDELMQEWKELNQDFLAEAYNRVTKELESL